MNQKRETKDKETPEPGPAVLDLAGATAGAIDAVNAIIAGLNKIDRFLEPFQETILARSEFMIAKARLLAGLDELTK